MARILTKFFRGQREAFGGVSNDVPSFPSRTELGDHPGYLPSTNAAYMDCPLGGSFTEGRAAIFVAQTTNAYTRTIDFLFSFYEGANQRILLRNDYGIWFCPWVNAPVTVGVSTPKYMPLIPTDYRAHIIEVYWKCDGANGIIRVYQNGILIFECLNVNIGTVGIDKVALGNPGGAGYSGGCYGFLLVDDANTEFAYKKFARLLATGAGSSTGMTPKPDAPNYQKVDEHLANYFDYNLATAADQKDTFACGDLPADVASIDSVRVAGVAGLNSQPAFDKVKSVVRLDSTDYEGAANTIVNDATHFEGVWTLNPATSAAWQPSEVNGMEFGVKAVSA